VEISSPSSDAALTYVFEDFELDPARFELRERGERVQLEPQVLSILMLLASNPDRLVSKDELVEKVWDGRFISDSAISARIKSARRALHDDGKQQRYIRTIHGKGFRFVGEISFSREEPNFRSLLLSAPPASQESGERSPEGRKPSIAVLPFVPLGAAGPLSIVADALADELITDLSRLRWILVIARGSTFRFRNRSADPQQVGRALDVEYCLSGSLEARGGQVTLMVELARTSDNAIVWADRFIFGAGEVHDVGLEIVARIISNLEVRIAQDEAQQARTRAPDDLDAWAAYHLGVDHMFRFSRSANSRAAEFFRQALSKSADFSRAHGGLSFTHFQDAFLGYSAEARQNAELARSFAEKALQSDPFDPFAHLNLGRSLWLEGEIGESIDRLSESISLSPNYAQAIYSKAWAEMTQCNPQSSDEDAQLALRLSPLDPLRYAMLGVRSVNALMRGDYQNAAEWGQRAARSPGAHKHIAVIAALGTQLGGHCDTAKGWVARAKQQDPELSKATFLRSFPFASSEARETIEATLSGLGL
jgi:TolB-like protein/Flp pilus assembly protein TadD